MVFINPSGLNRQIGWVRERENNACLRWYWVNPLCTIHHYENTTGKSQTNRPRHDRLIQDQHIAHDLSDCPPRQNMQIDFCESESPHTDPHATPGKKNKKVHKYVRATMRRHCSSEDSRFVHSPGRRRLAWVKHAFRFFPRYRSALFDT